MTNANNIDKSELEMPEINFDDLDFRFVIRGIGGKTTQQNAKRIDEATNRTFKIGDYIGDRGDIYAQSHTTQLTKETIS